MTQTATVRMLLQHVVDPELGMNIIELGLVYSITIEENKLSIVMTMTSAACPLSGVIIEDIHRVLGPLGFDDINVELTFDPPWSPDKMAPEARERLGF